MNLTLSHVAIIMDGNGRWAQTKKQPRIQGHLKGQKTAQKLILGVQRRKIPYLTLFAFSAENWRRPVKEISMIIRLCEEVLGCKKSFFHENKIKVDVIGDIEKFPVSLQEKIHAIKKETEVYKHFTLILALSYGGRQEILKAFKRMKDKGVSEDKMSLETIEAHLDTYGFPHPDLVIRTGGVRRLSNFLIWQTAYSELFFSSKMWPDFNESDLDEALLYYKKIERRYGGVCEVNRS